MSDDLRAAVLSSVSAIRTQSNRIRIVSENLANAGTTATTPGGEPYRRKTISFREELDRSSGAHLVQVGEIRRDRTPFQVRHDPGHPAADENGNVRLPNVNPLIEMADLREAHRSYEASLQVVRQSREMTSDLIDLLRGKA